MKVVFLDRDGTINEEVNYLHRPEDLRFVPGVPQALARLNAAGFLLVVVTNQAGIARGYYTEKDCAALNAYMNRALAAWGAHIDAFYFCPHYPDKGLGAYRCACRCRKPGTARFEQAERDLAAGLIGPGLPAQTRAVCPELSGCAGGDAGESIRAKDAGGGNARALEAGHSGRPMERAGAGSGQSIGPAEAAAVLNGIAGGWPAGRQLPGIERLFAGAQRTACQSLRMTGPEPARIESLFAEAQETGMRLDWASSFMLGDKLIDTRAGHNFGLRSLLLGSGYGQEEREKAEAGDFDRYFRTMEEGVTWILEQSQD